MKIRSVQTNDRICLTDVGGAKTGRLRCGVDKYMETYRDSLIYSSDGIMTYYDQALDD